MFLFENRQGRQCEGTGNEAELHPERVRVMRSDTPAAGGRLLCRWRWRFQVGLLVLTLQKKQYFVTNLSFFFY